MTNRIPVSLITEMSEDYEEWAYNRPWEPRYKKIADFLAIEAGLAKEVWIDEDGNECCDASENPIWEDTADHSHELTIVRD